MVEPRRGSLIGRRAILSVGLLLGAIRLAAEPGETTVWRLADLGSGGGPAIERIGSPAVEGGAVRFDGKTTGLLVSANPLAGSERFTIQILVYPAEGGLPEQRFFHLQDTATNRVMIETRLNGKGGWWLDTFLGNSTGGQPLIDPTKVHLTNHWYWVAIQYDGKIMSDYVEGAQESAAKVAFGPMVAGRLSLGVRQNKVYWFKGLIREVRFSPEALPPEKLERLRARP